MRNFLATHVSSPGEFGDTVDGSEIRRSPFEVGSLSHYLPGFYASQVVQDFFHQQYVSFQREDV